MTKWADVVACAVGYGLGSVPVGLWMGRVRSGLDVREHGSGSTGTTNVLRLVGPGAAAATFGLDVAKGAAAVGIARALGAGDAGQAAAGIAAVIGHSWPAMARFRGGKSVATAFGGLIMVAPGSVPWALGAGIGALVTTRVVSVGSLSATAAATVAAGVDAAVNGHLTALEFTAPAAAVVFARHGANIRRLARGEEPRVSLHRGGEGRAAAG